MLLEKLAGQQAFATGEGAKKIGVAGQVEIRTARALGGNRFEERRYLRAIHGLRLLNSCAGAAAPRARSTAANPYYIIDFIIDAAADDEKRD